MKKGKIFFMLVTMVIAMSVFASCNCGKETNEEQVKLNPTNNFSELVWKINENVMRDYPTFGFYEAFAYTAEYDSTNYGVIDPVTLRVVYGDTEYLRTVMAYVDEDWNLCYDVIDEPWLEDEFTTPYVPMDLTDALAMIQKEIDIVYGPGTIAVLRHQLYYKEPEPRFFIGPLSALHTVNVYTGEIDAQLTEVSEALTESMVYLISAELEDATEPENPENPETELQ